MPFLSIAIPAPLRRSFDYLPPKVCPPAKSPRWSREYVVSAPFAGRQLTGILLAVKDESDVPASQLKQLSAILDTQVRALDRTTFPGAVGRQLLPAPHW